MNRTPLVRLPAQPNGAEYDEIRVTYRDGSVLVWHADPADTVDVTVESSVRTPGYLDDEDTATGAYRRVQPALLTTAHTLKVTARSGGSDRTSDNVLTLVEHPTFTEHLASLPPEQTRVIVLHAPEAIAWRVLEAPPPGTRAVMVNADDPHPVASILSLMDPPKDATPV